MTKGTGRVDTVAKAADVLKEKMGATHAAQGAFAQARLDFLNAEGRLTAAQEAEADAHDVLRKELAARRHVRNAR